MAAEYYCLKWSNHQSNMLSAFGNLLSNEALCDVTIACDGLSLKAHKLVLSASSSFFHKLFLENQSTNPIVILSDLKYADMKALVDFMYHGHVNVSESQLSTILKAAENLKIKGLGDCMEHSLNLNDHQYSAVKTKPVLLKRHANNLFSDSGICNNVSDFKNQTEELQTDTSSYVKEVGLSCDQQSESNLTCSSSEVDQSHAPGNEQENEIDMVSISDAHLEIMPSKLMEQTMTTEGVFTQQSFMEIQSASKSPSYETDKNTDYDSVRINLPENVHLSELENANLGLSQGYLSSSKGDNNQLIVRTTHVTDCGSVVHNDESLGSLQGSTSFMSENFADGQRTISLGNSLSVSMLDCLAESSKRGRKPGSRLCALCKRIFNSESELEKHMNNHKTGSISEDADSRKLPELMDSSDTQVITEKNLLKMPLLCSSCKYEMNTLSDAQSHLSLHPNCRTSQFKCLLCPKLFIWPATLMKHFREQHEGPGGLTRVTRRMWFFCDVCKKPLLSKHALSLHKSKFHNQTLTSGSLENLVNCKRGRKRGSRVCGICKRTFLGSDYFTHVQTAHKNANLSNTSVEVSVINESLSLLETHSQTVQNSTSLSNSSVEASIISESLVLLESESNSTQSAA